MGKVLDNAVEWLEDRLSDGPWLAKDLIKDATEVGFSYRTLVRAKDELGYITIKAGFGDQEWLWYNPAFKMEDPKLREAWFGRIQEWKNNAIGDDELELFYNQERHLFWDEEQEEDESWFDHECIIYKESESGIKTTSVYQQNVYTALAEQGIYYYNPDDDFSELSNCPVEWQRKLRAEPHRIKRFKNLKDLTPKKIKKFDNWWDEDKRKVWLEVKEKILAEGWIEQATALYDKYYETYIRDQYQDEMEDSRKHRILYDQTYDHNFQGEAEQVLSEGNTIPAKPYVSSKQFFSRESDKKLRKENEEKGNNLTPEEVEKLKIEYNKKLEAEGPFEVDINKLIYSAEPTKGAKTYKRWSKT